MDKPLEIVGYVLVFSALIVILAEMVRYLSYVPKLRQSFVSIKKFERHSPTANKRILFIGDSIGHGAGASAPKYSLVGRLGTDFPSAHIENMSTSLATLSRARNVLKHCASRADATPFDVIIILIGGADIVFGTPLWRVRRLLCDVISYSKQCGRETILICPNNPGLAPLYRFPLSFIYSGRARKFDTMYRQLAQTEGIHFISLYHESNDPLVTNGHFAIDKSHPNDSGYELWYADIKELVNRILCT